MTDRTWIVDRIGLPAFDSLATGLPGSDLHSVLLEVMRQRAAGRSPADVLAAGWRSTGRMKATLEKAFGYQGDAMNLPLRDLDKALPFYETVLGFRVASRAETPDKAAVLARDEVEIRLVENGGDPSQDGCAFHVMQLESLFAEFKSNGLEKEISEFGIEQHGDVPWRVFYVVAPDGLCYWFGERQASE